MNPVFLCVFFFGWFVFHMTSSLVIWVQIHLPYFPDYKTQNSAQLFKKVQLLFRKIRYFALDAKYTVADGSVVFLACKANKHLFVVFHDKNTNYYKTSCNMVKKADVKHIRVMYNQV